jgi:hypothetical protein
LDCETLKGCIEVLFDEMGDEASTSWRVKLEVDVVCEVFCVNEGEGVGTQSSRNGN